MPFTGMFDQGQLAVLYKVLDDHCTTCGVERSSPEGTDAAYLLLSLFEKGAQTVEELKDA